MTKKVPARNSLATLTFIFLQVFYFNQTEATAQNSFVENQESNFVHEFKRALESCPDLNCDYFYDRTLSHQEIRAMGGPSLQRIRFLIKDFARTYWPDTVLEGSIVTQFQIRIDSLSEVSVQGNPSALLVNFSAKAWDHDDCSNVMVNQEQANLFCQPGKITHQVFISMNKKNLIQDEDRRPVFIPKQN